MSLTIKKVVFWGIVIGTFYSLSLYGESDLSSKVSLDTNRNKDSLFLHLTLEELAEYNGKNGKPSYVAIDSFIYDVTPIKVWKKGNHKGLHSAGTDLTEEIKKAPHRGSVLKKLKIVGKIVKQPPKK